MEYTKGEWKVNKFPDTRILIVAPPAEICTMIYEKLVSEAEANAHLIAAAPDMYEALKAVMKEEIFWEDVKLTTATVQSVSKALAKAEMKQ